jgi:hypothetical protein
MPMEIQSFFRDWRNGEGGNGGQPDKEGIKKARGDDQIDVR